MMESDWNIGGEGLDLAKLDDDPHCHRSHMTLGGDIHRCVRCGKDPNPPHKVMMTWETRNDLSVLANQAAEAGINIGAITTLIFAYDWAASKPGWLRGIS